MIIIKTPQPDAEERLVLVPVRRIVPESRDATPDDLARAGYVPRAMLTPDERTLCAESELDAEREETRHLRIRLSEQHERAEKAERERDDARRLHSAAEAQVACRSELRAQLAAAERERDEEKRAHTLTLGRLALAEIGRSEADTLRAELARLTPVEGEPTDNELRAAWDPESTMTAGRRAVCRLGVAHERARSAVALRRLGGKPGESVEGFVSRLLSGGGFVQWGDGTRAHTQPEKDRATDEELRDLYESAWDACPGNAGESKLAAIRAVAAHVRKERCLVAQAVEANVDIRVCEDDGGGFMVGVHAPDCDEDLERNVPAADVPATLARLLGEVAK